MKQSQGTFLLVANTKIFSLLFFLGLISTMQAQVAPPYPSRFDNIQIRADHPRIWIDAKKTTWLKEKFKGKSSDEVQQLAGPSIIGLALTYVITGDEKWGRKAIEKALAPQVDPGSKYKDLNSIEGRSKSRDIQRHNADQAICYDWCYPLLSAAEKANFIAQLVPTMKKSLAYKRVWRSFHNGMYANAWPITAAAIALYGDEPYAKEVIDFLKPELEDAMRTADIVFPDGEWPEGMDYNRHSTYHTIRILLAIKSATGFDALKNSPHIKNTAKNIIYASKPDGMAIADDDNDWPYLGDWEHVALLMLNSEFRDAHTQNFINNCPVERFQLEPEKQYANVLWYDSSIKEKPLTDLPKSRIFRGKGLVIARSGWSWDMPNKKSNDTWLSFHCGDYQGDHVHHDINNFSIYHKGELAIDAGRYDDDWGTVIGDPKKIDKSQFFNYYKRTIAHNTILVYDPNEKMSAGIINDGGQLDQLRPDEPGKELGKRNVPEDYDQGNFPSEEGMGKCDWKTNPGRWETGDITSYKATNDFMYVKGDATKAYSANKMKSYIRQLVYVQPDVIVVMDRVVSTNPDFKKTWLLHSMSDPKIAKDNSSLEIIDQDGRLVCVPVLPHKLVVSKVGGEGKEMLVGDKNFPSGMNSAFDPTEYHYGEMGGAWRIEESPEVAAAEDYFLNVIQVSDKDSKEIPVVKILSETASDIAIQVTVGQKSSILKFTKGENPSAAIKIINNKKTVVDEKMPDSIELEKGREK